MSTIFTLSRMRKWCLLKIVVVPISPFHSTLKCSLVFSIIPGKCGRSVGGEEGGVGCVWEERRGVWGKCGRRGGGCGVSVGGEEGGVG